MSFLLDIPALFLIGIVLVWFRNTFCWKRKSIKNPDLLCYMSLVIMILFWAGALALYLDLIDLGFISECLSPGSKFMWNSCLNLGIQHHPGMHPIAVLLFGSYPLWLYLGVSTGRVLFGRRPGQQGLLWLLRVK